MEPTHNSYQPSAELPHPQDEANLQGGPVSSEAAPAAPERAPQPLSAPVGTQPLQPLTAQPGQPLPASQQPAAPAVSATSTNDLIADDVDLIEKEWVVKAKAIVAQTKDDPYQQNLAVSQVKADYLKKRYNKDLKVSNET